MVILGGGPAGAATALSLRQHAPSLSLALIERSNYNEIRIGESLPPTVQPLLEQLGAWHAFLNEGHIPAYGICAAWGSDELFENEFIYHPAGRGWHLDRKRFDAMLAGEGASRGAIPARDLRLPDRPAKDDGGSGCRLKTAMESRSKPDLLSMQQAGARSLRGSNR